MPWPTVRSWQQSVETSQNWPSYNYVRSCADLNINHSMVIQHLKQIGKVKKLSKWVLYELTVNQKNHRFEVLFEVLSLILCNNSKSFLNWVMKCDEEWLCMTTSSVAGPKSSSEVLPVPNLHPPKKVMASVWWFPAGLIHYSFLIPGETIGSEIYVQQNLKCTKSCNACSQHWSTGQTNSSPW